MRALLDTHVLLWWLSDDRALPAGAIDFIEDRGNDLYVSAISMWEVAIKSQLGKLSVEVDEFRQALAPAGFRLLSFSVDDAAAISKLPTLHRDPFDRALIAQATCGRLRLITADEQLFAYGDPVTRLTSL